MKKFLTLLFLALLTGCGGETYMPGLMILSIYAYDENTNGIVGLKVTYTLTTNGVTETDIKYTDTNGLAKSKEFYIDYRVLPFTNSEDEYKVFNITIEDEDGTNNGGKFVTTNFLAYDCLMKIFLQRE